MKKILMSLMVIAVTIGVVATGLSGAWFSDVESTAGNPGANSLTAGSIDLDPIAGAPIVLTGLQPCETGWGYMQLHNVGQTDGNAWLHFTNVMNAENGTTDAEDEAYLERSGYDPDALRFDNDLERFMTVDVYLDPIANGVLDGGGTYVITQAAHQKLADLECQWIPLGELKISKWVEVWLSFHIQPEAGNQYQTDMVTFDIEVMLQQSGAPAPDNEWPSDMRVLRLENKDANWAPIIEGSSTYGILTYDCKKTTFAFTFEGYGLQNVEYDLIYYADPWPGDHPGALIASGTASGGTLSLSGSVELDMDLPNAADWNHPDGAKIWLVTASDYDGAKMTAWNPADYLFEMRLIHYDDTNSP